MYDIPVPRAAKSAGRRAAIARRLRAVAIAAAGALMLAGCEETPTGPDPMDDAAATAGRVAAAASAVDERAEQRRLLDRAEAVVREHPTYYGTAWVALGRLMLTTSRLGDC